MRLYASMRQRELGVRHIEFVSPRCREGVRRVEANMDSTQRAQNGTNVEWTTRVPGSTLTGSVPTNAGAQRGRSVVE
jgi:hypothetical protein